MTYTLAADIYLGDFSSQLYEFLVLPRACVFLDVRGEGGIDDSKLPEMWRCGETVTGLEDVIGALDRSMKRHPEYRPHQSALVLDAYGDPAISASMQASDELIAMTRQVAQLGGGPPICKPGRGLDVGEEIDLAPA